MAGNKKRCKTVAAIALGTYLRSLRQAADLSQREVEERAHGKISNSYLSQIENGFVPAPRPRILLQLASIYNTDVNQLFKVAYNPNGEQCLETEQLAKQSVFSINGLDRDETIALQAFLAYYRQFARGQ